ncbi:hypothetical protein DCAR_0206083 [Daucus carota subsp. sativus]|uniref:Uncharacterized protein n=1 Tax=Daucus carota subsp. sativus TaxID=79200 RepID=A0A166D0Z1_DAUCS|nr:hypothetical protein DCAR_0206083 [Daucus carota subsp. sativus]
MVFRHCHGMSVELERGRRGKIVGVVTSVVEVEVDITSPNDIDGSSTDADTSQDSQKLIQVYECRRSKRVCKTAKCGTDGEDNAKK